MRLAIGFCYFLSIFALHASSVGSDVTSTLQSLEVNGGQIFDGVLSSNAVTAYFQQRILVDYAVSPHAYSVKLTAFDARTLALRAARTFSARPGSLTGAPCRGMRIGALSKLLFICSGDDSLDVLDPTDLHSVRSIRPLGGGIIRSFALDERLDQLFILTQSSDTELCLEYLSLTSGKLIQRLKLPSSHAVRAVMALTGAEGGTKIALSFDPGAKLYDHTDVYTFVVSPLMKSQQHSNANRISDLLFLRNDLLLVPSGTPCMRSVDSSNGGSIEAFCGSTHGLKFSRSSRYSAALVGERYLVDLIGSERAKLFSDMVIESISSELGIWDLATGRRIGRVSLPKEFVGLISGARVVGDEATPWFLAFQSNFGSSTAFIGQIVSAVK